jgi:hypothetical protein
VLLAQLDIPLEAGVPSEGGNGVFGIGLARRYVVNDLVAAFCCLVCRNIDFQQLNGRSVGVGVAIVLVWKEV